MNFTQSDVAVDWRLFCRFESVNVVLQLVKLGTTVVAEETVELLLTLEFLVFIATAHFKLDELVCF